MMSTALDDVFFLALFMSKLTLKLVMLDILQLHESDTNNNENVDRYIYFHCRLKLLLRPIL